VTHGHQSGFGILVYSLLNISSSCHHLLPGPFIMFRQSAAHLRQLASPLLKRSGLRLRTTKAQPDFNSKYGYKPFWNSGRVLLFSTATGMTTYFYGANDETTRFPSSWRRTPGPQYASKVEMERASRSSSSSCHELLSIPLGDRGVAGSSWRRCDQYRRRRPTQTWILRMVVHQHHSAASCSGLSKINGGSFGACKGVLQV
jgi:hypothetical protein